MTFRRRRLINSLLLMFFWGLFTGLAVYYGKPLYLIQISSGWMLLILNILLYLYSIRKKITLLPVGKTSNWLQFHLYTGVFTSLVFFQHISFQVPTGIFESILAFLFIATVLSGVLGMICSRSIPKRLTRRGEEVIYEKIPFFTHQLRKKAEAIILECTFKTQSTALAEYYQNHLAEFFFQPRVTAFHLYGSLAQFQAMNSQHNNFCRYLNKVESIYAEQLLDLVKKKYDLDFHYSLQNILKIWLFVHIPLTYGLLVCMLVHLMLVYAFVGGLP